MVVKRVSLRGTKLKFIWFLTVSTLIILRIKRKKERKKERWQRNFQWRKRGKSNNLFILFLISLFFVCLFVCVVRVLKTLFDSCDEEEIGSINMNQLPGLLVKIGKDEGRHSFSFDFIF